MNQSRSSGAKSPEKEETRLPPLRVLDGRGFLLPPPVEVKPLVTSAAIEPSVSLENPPGFYGTEDGFIALNLFKGDENLEPLDTNNLADGVEIQAYSSGLAIDLTPWLLMAAAFLLVLDCLAVLWISGALKRHWRTAPIRA